MRMDMYCDIEENNGKYKAEKSMNACNIKSHKEETQIIPPSTSKTLIEEDKVQVAH